MDPSTPEPVDLPEQAETVNEERADSTQINNSAKESAQGGFLFIQSTGPNQRQSRNELRRLRGHVMHNYLGRKHETQHVEQADGIAVISSQNVLTNPTKYKPNVSGGQKMRFRMKAGEMELRRPSRYMKRRKSDSREVDMTDKPGVSGGTAATTTSSMPGVAAVWSGLARVDPFGILPIDMKEGDEKSLSIFRSYRRFPYCPINGQSSWTPFALSDQLVFHATMYSFGSHFRHVRPVPDPEEETRTLQHKLSAISLINKRLSDPNQAASDATVAAVAALTNIALVVDSFPEATKHLSGMWAIVEMRGGLASLQSHTQQHLQRLISWNDLIYSEVFDQRLRFPPISVWDESWGGYQGPNNREPLPGLSRADLRSAGVPYHEVLDILVDIRVLCEAEQLTPLTSCDDAQRMRRGDMFHRIERRLRVIIQGNTALGNNRWDATVWRAVCLAGVLYTHHNLRGNPLKYRHFNVLSMQLYDTLRTMDDHLADLDFATSLSVWVLTTGAVVSELSYTVHVDLLSLLANVCNRYSLRDYESYQWTLRNFLWTGAVDEARYKRLWQELEPRLRLR